MQSQEATVRVVWGYPIPKDKKTVDMCKSFMTQAAKDHGMDLAVVRMHAHNTKTITGCKHIKVPWHITGTIVCTKKGEEKGFSVHLNLNDDGDAPLPSNPEVQSTDKWDLPLEDVYACIKKHKVNT